MRVGELNKTNYAQFIKTINPGAKNAKVAVLEASVAATKSLKHTENPYAKPGQDITNNTTWKKTVSISGEVRAKLLSIVKDDFKNNFGMSGENYDDPNGYNATVTKYLSSLPPDERSSASWTLSHLFTDEAQRLATIVRENNPGWEFGQPFDTSILNENTTHNELDIKV